MPNDEPQKIQPAPPDPIGSDPGLPTSDDMRTTEPVELPEKFVGRSKTIWGLVLTAAGIVGAAAGEPQLAEDLTQIGDDATSLISGALVVAGQALTLYGTIRRKTKLYLRKR